MIRVRVIQVKISLDPYRLRVEAHTLVGYNFDDGFGTGSTAEITNIEWQRRQHEFILVAYFVDRNNEALELDLLSVITLECLAENRGFYD